MSAFMGPPPPSGDNDSKKPQEIVNEFWDNLITKKPGKVTTIFPQSLYANLLPRRYARSPAHGINARASYEAAAEECRARVKRIVRECRRTNEKFTDSDFEFDIQYGGNTLNGLLSCLDDDDDAPSNGVDGDALQEALSTLTTAGVFENPTAVSMNVFALKAALEKRGGSGSGPGSVHRVDWIFDKPSFTLDGYSSSDVQQGSQGDCWFISAIANVCSNQKLMDRICVARDEECGVYGFVFYRDGEWISTVVDDNLYLSYEDFAAWGDNYDPTHEKEKRYKKNNQPGSEALYFAHCADSNETWLPLLEKAYAKAHGDYEAISGGNAGEGVEDLTGGVTSKILTNRILSRDRLWKELLQVNDKFLFAASSPGAYGTDSDARQGLALSHAYSILKAVEEADEEGNPHRLVLIRNPWGKRSGDGQGEWTGAWSDGSKEWTPYWMQKLNHRFGDDGEFWMSYEDLTKRFDLLDRTRVFDEDWTVVQKWTSVSVAWVTGYLTTKFVVELNKGGPTVFVLSQLDSRYFRGLEGQYTFELHFLLQEEGADTGDHIVRAGGLWSGERSISAEVELEPGRYEVIPKIVAWQIPGKLSVPDVVQSVANRNPQKLRQIGLNYDMAHARAEMDMTEAEQRQKEEEEKKREEAEKEKAEFEQWKKEKKEKEEREAAAKAAAAAAKKGKKGGKTGKQYHEQKHQKSLLHHPKGKKHAPPPVEEPEEEEEEEEEEEAEGEEGEWVDEDDEGGDDEEVGTEGGSAVSTGSIGGPDSDDKVNSWNAVAVIGLRVYAQDPEVTITLVRPMDPEQGASLDVAGQQAGATM